MFYVLTKLVELMASTTAASAFVQFHSLSSNPQLFLPKLPNLPISLSSSSKRTSNYKRVCAKAVSTDSQKPLTQNNQNTPSSSSSKLVLVLGASGGVGKHLFIIFLSVSLIFVIESWNQIFSGCWNLVVVVYSIDFRLDQLNQLVNRNHL